MKKLIHTNNLQETLEKIYVDFVDERGRIIEVNIFADLFYYKYANSVEDIWQFWIEENCLHCENISGFKIIFPLKRA